MQTVLIVDDEIGFLQSIEAGLVGYGERFRVRTASNGLAALKIIEEEKVDLLVTDLRMPEMDGFALLAHIASAHPFLPAIVLTAFATPEIEESVNATGTAKLLEKPVELDRLAEAILEGCSRKARKGPWPAFLWPTFSNCCHWRRRPVCSMSKTIDSKATSISSREKSPPPFAGRSRERRPFFGCLKETTPRSSFSNCLRKKSPRISTSH